MNRPSFFSELKRRNVYKVAVAYAVVGWLLLQLASILFPAFEAPAWVMKAFIALVAAGFPIALLLAWAFELTPEGIKRSDEVTAEESAQNTGRKLRITIAVVGVLALGLLLFSLMRPKSVAPSAAAAPAAVVTLPTQSISSKSIAVLPFQNLSTDQENAFFADGVQDEILTTLAKVADLKVISRTSVMQYKEIEKRNLPEIAQALKVAHILEGSVQRSSNRVRVSAQLIDARTDAHLWAERYDRELADVFAIQSEIAQKIAEQLQAVLSPKEKAAIAAKPTADLAAYDLYLRAKESRQSILSAEDLHESIRLLDEAVKRDPAFVSALCLLARAHLSLYWRAFDETPQPLELAQRAIEAAARVEPASGEVHLARAFFHYWGKREYDAALAELALAGRTLPNDADIRFLTGSLQRRQGKWEDATRHLEAAATLDPRNSIYQIELAGIYRQQRRYPEAAQVLDTALALAPHDFALARTRAILDFSARGDLRRLQEVAGGEAVRSANPDDAADFRMQLALLQHDYRAAREALAAYRPREFTAPAGYVLPREWFEGLIGRGLGNAEQSQASFLAARERAATRVAARPDDGIALVVLAQIDARLGRKEEAVREAERAMDLHAAAGDELSRTTSANRVAGIYAQVGEFDRAFDLLEQAAKRPNGPTYGSLKLSEDWDPLRSNPRFEKILAALAPKDAPPAK